MEKTLEELFEDIIYEYDVGTRKSQAELCANLCRDMLAEAQTMMNLTVEDMIKERCVEFIYQYFQEGVGQIPKSFYAEKYDQFLKQRK